MLFIGTSNNRAIYYFPLKSINDLCEQLPDEKWLSIIIGDTKDLELVEKIANICLNKNVSYFCTTGKECEWIHDTIDTTIVIREIDFPDLPQCDPMTTWHQNIDECLWFAIYCAIKENSAISKIVSINLTETDYKNLFIDTIFKINCGWEPEY